ncbi:MAG: carbohydrate binding family 9 domain-containing protein [Candidatus Eisenbacteria bacterium]|nr:carbohydrate binding family 9 domain-containing protein [Candidatus Eisenbacteria bacterium]
MAKAARVLIIALLGAFLPAAARALDHPAVAATRAGGSLRVDGVLDEPDWARAEPITDFRLIFNREGEVPAESTEVRVLFDDGRIYFGLRCANRTPGAIRASLTPRDQNLDDDNVAVHLDTYHDRRRAYVFVVNPYGVQADGILTGTEPDFDWDGVWDAECTRDAQGWSAEIAVPLRTLRFSERGDGVWGLWIRRQVTKKDEVCSWPLWKLSVAGDIMLQGGDLTGLTGLKGGGGLEAQPYVASTRSDTRGWSDSRNSLTDWSRDSRSDAGLDLKVAPSGTLAANLTFNPDYSQVEADALQIDVNRRYALYYPEKRPFFLEGAEIFATPLGLVYTRRMADPLAGGKLTGRAGRWRLGALALWDDGGGSTAGIGGGPSSGGPSPEGAFAITRAAVDVGEGSGFGLLATAHYSRWPRGVIFTADANPQTAPDQGYNLVLAGDARLRLSRTTIFTGQVATSSTVTDSVANFSPPPTARFSDLAYDATLAYTDGIRDLKLFQQYFGPDFRAETGFIKRTDTRKSGINSDFYVRPQNAWLRSWEPILNGYVIHDRAGRIQEWWVSPMVDWKLQKQFRVHTMYERSMERWISRDYRQNRYILELESSTLRAIALSAEMEVGEGIYYGPSDSASFLGWTEEYRYQATLRPSPRLTAELTANQNRFSRGRGRGVLYDVWVLGARTTYQFTRRLYARVYPQVDTEAEHVDLDALLGYVIQPGSVLYAGVNADVDRFNGHRYSTGRTFFLKASYRFLR